MKHTSARHRIRLVHLRLSDGKRKEIIQPGSNMFLAQIPNVPGHQIFHNIYLQESGYSNRLSSPHDATWQGRSYRSRFISIVYMYLLWRLGEQPTGGTVKARLYHNKNILTIW